MRLVIKQEAYPEDLQKGEAIVYEVRKHEDNSILRYGLILACPQCGFVSTGSHSYNKQTQSLSPSIVCGECNYHGHLKNGIFDGIKQTT